MNIDEFEDYLEMQDRSQGNIRRAVETFRAKARAADALLAC